MTRGVVLLSFGKRGYEFSAYNLALSLKYFNPEIQITLLTDCIKEVKTTFFDSVVIIPILPTITETKTSIYEYLPYDINIYLDVDSIALKDITPLFDMPVDYSVQITGSHVIGTGKFDEMYWADIDTIKNKYDLQNGSNFYASNSSFQFIRKCENSAILFKKVNELLKDPIPINELAVNWGGGQPDELYLNIALNKSGIEIQPIDVLFLGNKYSDLSFDDIIKKYYTFTFFGGKGFTKKHYIEWYDRMMHVFCSSFRLSHIYKNKFIEIDKHLNNK